MKIFDAQNNFYVPGFFWIELDTAKDLNEIFGTDLEHSYFHEYLHFLQDITTAYSYANFSHLLNLIKSFYHHIEKMRQLQNYDLYVPFDFSNDSFRDTNSKLFRTYLQYFDDKDYILDHFDINGIVSRVESINGFNVQTFTINYNDDKKIKLGTHAIFESISHILQKECYKICDNKIHLPYDLPMLIADKYSNVFKDRKYLIDLCEYSLMFYNSGEVFMDILTGIKKDNYTPKDSNEFYEYMKKQVILGDETIESFFKKEKNELVSNIKGVFVSELYEGYRKWLIDIIEKGYDLKAEKNLIFSKILSYNPTRFLKDTILDIGMPPTFNQDGKMFIKNSLFDVESWNYLARAITSVFETIIAGKNNCLLKEACLISNELQDKQILITNDCDNEPWKKINEEELCPYCAVWKTFGLNRMIVHNKVSI
jgi:hypothetical protein